MIGGMGHSKREDTGSDGTAENKVGRVHGSSYLWLNLVTISVLETAHLIYNPD